MSGQDLEQFREAVDFMLMHGTREQCIRAGDMLQAIIDNAGKAEVEPSAVRSLVAAANAVLALYPGDDLLWTLESAVRPFNATKPAECAKECPPQQVCDYCQIASNAQQPAAVVDDAARLLAICQNAHDRLLRGDDDSELLAILEQAWNAREAVESP